MFQPTTPAQDIAFLPADEALFLGASLAHVAAYYERQRLQRIDRQNRIAFERHQARGR